MLYIKIWEVPHLKTVKPILIRWDGDKESLLAALKIWQPVPGVTIPLRRLLIHKLEKVIRHEAGNYKRHGATDSGEQPNNDGALHGRIREYGT